MATNTQDDTSLHSQVLASHGGMSAWKKIHSNTFKVNFSGGLLALKGFPGHYQLHVRIDLTAPRTEMRGWKTERPSDVWIYTPQRVWTQNAEGTILQSRESPREGYEGHVLTTKWDDLHLTYFVGYALWNYATIPFMIEGPGFQTREIEEHLEPGYVNSSGAAESWRVLEVTFPEKYDAHTRFQKFYFDREKLWVRRMDYVTEVARGVGAHYCFDHKAVNGIVLPTLRRVVRRDAENVPQLFGPTAFLLEYFEVEFEE